MKEHAVARLGFVDLRHRFAISEAVSPRSPFRLNWQVAREAAVLLAIMCRGDGLHVLLTRRSEHLLHHPGQISFPGGRIEKDDTDAVAAAMREAEEEVGLPAGRVEMLGRMGPFQTGTGFIVHTVLGFVEAPPVLRPDPREVAGMLEVPLDLVLDMGCYRPHRLERNGQVYEGVALDYRGDRIWGATACILHCLAEWTNGAPVRMSE